MIALHEIPADLEQINPDAFALVEIALSFAGPNHDGDSLSERMDKAELFVNAHGYSVDPDIARVARWTLAGSPLDGPEFERCVN